MERQQIFVIVGVVLVFLLIFGFLYFATDIFEPNVAGEGYSFESMSAGLAHTNISSCTKLQNMNSNLSGNYVLTQNISCSNTSTWNGGKGFKPIGNSTDPFTGTFNGKNHTISSIYINRPTETSVGLFGKVFGAEIDSVRLVDVMLRGNMFVGGLTGSIRYGTVSSVRSVGTIVGNRSVGGIAGVAQAKTNISKSYFVGNVSGGADSVGGIVGNLAYSKVNTSYTTGTVFSRDSAGGAVGYCDSSVFLRSYARVYVAGLKNSGGLIGYVISCNVSNSYSKGSVVGNETVGGLIGYSDSESIVSNTYSIGNVSGNYSVGGLIGNSTSIVNNSYWDVNTSGKSTSSEGIGKTTKKMKNITTFANWNISENSEYVAFNKGYPYLSWQVPGNSPVWYIYAPCKDDGDCSRGKVCEEGKCVEEVEESGDDGGGGENGRPNNKGSGGKVIPSEDDDAKKENKTPSDNVSNETSVKSISNAEFPWTFTLVIGLLVAIGIILILYKEKIISH